MIQIAICDDNREDREQLKNILKEVMSKYSVRYNIQEYEYGEKLLEVPLTFHIVFLDIMMSGKDGVEIGKQIYRRNRSIRIIYQTNFNQYCQVAINKSHAFAFLEKPLVATEVEEQILEYIECKDKIQEIRIEFRNVKYCKGGESKIQAILNVPIKTILYFEYIKMQREIKIVTDNECYLYSENMNKLENRVRTLGFEVSCRGILVNLERIRSIKGYTIMLDEGSTLPLSQRRVAEFKERINEYLHDSYN